MSSVLKAKLKAVLWDLDGTLINSEPIHCQAGDLANYEITAKYKLTHIVPAVNLQGMANFEVFKLFFPDLVGKPNLKLVFEEWEAIATKYVYKKITFKDRIKNPFRLFHYCSSLNLIQAVVSNSNQKLVMQSLKVLGINTKCDLILSREKVILPKPNPEIYQLAMTQLSLKSEECIAFEDSKTGINAAKEAGLFVIGVGQNSQKYEPDLVLLENDKLSLNQVLNLLKLI